MGKRIDVFCTLEIKDIFVTALRNYTDVAFPAGSADCVLVAREALFDTLAEFEAEYARNQDGHSSYNKRVRAMVKEGIRLHFQLLAADRGYECKHECALMLEVTEGIAHTDEELAAARAADRAKNTP